MPWNDEAKAGPWGAPPAGEGGREGAPPASGGNGGDSGGGGKGGDPGAKGPWGSGGGASGGSGGGTGGGGSSKPPGTRPPTPPRRSGRPPDDNRGPDLDELLAQLRARAEQLLGGAANRELPTRVVPIALGVVLVLWVFSGLFVVQPDQEGVVTRFGAYVRSERDGLRYHLPWPFEAAQKVSVTRLTGLDIGAPSSSAEGLMLTGDENIVDLGFTVQYKVSSAADYLFRVNDPEATVKMVAESAMREIVGKTALTSIITNGRSQVQQKSADLMQQLLDDYHAGVSIVQVQIRSANPPTEVIPAFRDVNNANQDAESLVNEAKTYRNQKVNEAKGDAARIVQAAQGYREQVAREAEGSASRFEQVYEQYKLAPAVTRERLYLETMERVLNRSNKVIVDTKGGTAPIVLPPDLIRAQPNPAAPVTTTPATPAPSSQPAPSSGQQTAAPQNSGGR